jgi:hypothetical protein
MYISRELNRCFAEKQALLQESESNRDLIRSETLRIGQQTEGWLGTAAAVAQKVSTIASGIFSFRFVTGIKMPAPLRLLSRAFTVAQTLGTLWSRQPDRSDAASASPDSGSSCPNANRSTVSNERKSEAVGNL